jgi:1,4-dihydroxy-2-naphthoate octaprenyltransferase
MRFFAALFVHLLMGLLIGSGILLLAARGQWWLLITAVAVYVATLYYFGVKPNCPPAGPTAH